MKFYLKHSSNCSRNPSCSSVFLLMVEDPTYQWAILWMKRIYFLPNTHHRYKNTHRYVPWYFVRLHKSQVYRHQHCVPRRPFDQMPCHTHGGLDTYHSLSANVSSHYSIHQMLLHIHASHYYRRLRAEMCLCLIELTWSVFASLHTSQCYESLPVWKHWIIGDSLIT